MLYYPGLCAMNYVSKALAFLLEGELDRRIKIIDNLDFSNLSEDTILLIDEKKKEGVNQYVRKLKSECNSIADLIKEIRKI